MLLQLAFAEILFWATRVGSKSPSGASVELRLPDDLAAGTLSFAVPALEPGSIIEHQFAEPYTEPISLPLSIPLQLERSIRRRMVSYPTSWQPHYFHCDNCAADLLLTTRSSQSADDFWRLRAAQRAKTFEQELSPVPPRLANDLTALVEFCRTEIKNSLYRAEKPFAHRSH